MLKNAFCLASLLVACLAGNAQAQVPNLVNGNFETEDAYLGSFGLLAPVGFRTFSIPHSTRFWDSRGPCARARS